MSPKSTNAVKNLAIIMDGNGRWAEQRGLPRNDGHTAGIRRMLSLTSHAFDKGVRSVICYSLSTENLARAKEEVDHIFTLIPQYADMFVSACQKLGVAVRFVGDLSLLPEEVRGSMANTEQRTQSCSTENKTLYVAVAYGSRAEIVNAVNAAVAKGQPVTEQDFLQSLYYSVEPDLVVRTGGRHRLSNFALYQLSYAELYFSDKLFPDFSEDDLDAALDYYADVERTFGK